MSIVKDEQFESMKAAESDGLVEQLKEVFVQKFRHCQRIEVVGILSYTTDQSSEKFIKIDFSTSRSSLMPSTNLSYNESGMTHCDLRDFSDQSQDHKVDGQTSHHTGLEIFEDTETFKDSSPANASPPLLPPLVIQHNRGARSLIQYPGTINHDPGDDADNIECPKDVVDFGGVKRDRRKSRRPKRQIVDSADGTGDSEAEDGGTEQDEVVSSSDFDVCSNAKMPRLTCFTNTLPHSTVLSATSAGVADVMITHPSITTASSTDTYLTEAVKANSRDASQSRSQDYLKNCVQFSNCGTEPQTSQPTPTTKYTIATKTLGLNDLSELCNMLPLSSILGRTILSCNDTNSLTVKVASTHSGASNPVAIPLLQESTNQMSSNHCAVPTNVNQGQSPNVFLNTSLAAAVAAALSAPVHTNMNAVNCSDQNTITGIPSLNGPSIALTGPSGELLGTIPIGSTTQQHGILPSIIGNALATHSANPVSVANTVNVSVPVSSSTNGGSSLATTLNWLRYASASTDLGNHTNQTIQTSISNNGQMQNTNSSVALLQSLAGQNSIHSMNPASGKLSSISVGPTLALIGTLGLNPISCSASTSSTNEGITSTGVANTALLTTNIGLGTPSSNAALVAAALLRGLTGAKNSNVDTQEASYVETSVGGMPGAVTLITNSQLSSGVMTAGRPNLIATDGALSSLSSILSSKVTNVPSGSTTTVSVCDAPALCTSSFNRVNQNPQFISGVNSAVTRGSIMFSYPRGQGEMNLVLTPASAQPLTATSLSPALSFQNLLNSQPSSIALSSPVLLHAPLNASSGSKTTTTGCTISTVASTLTTSAPAIRPIQIKNNSETKTFSDPTTSAIDRILQTIKGCMSQENRENETRYKLAPAPSKKNDLINNPVSSIRSNSDDVTCDSTSVVESKRSYSIKLTPVTLSLNKTIVGASESDQSIKNGNSSKTSMVTNERVPLAPLGKDSNDHENPHMCRVTKVYRCRYCGKTFNRKFCRERHERLHTGVKPYTCEICEEKFIRLEDKKRHVRSLQHYLAGRGSYIKSESGDMANEDTTNLEIDPSTVLPLLAHTLQGVSQEGANGNFPELDEPACLSASEGTSNDQGSDCESFDLEDNPEKTATNYQVDVYHRVDISDDCSEAPDRKDTPVSCEENENTHSLSDARKICEDNQLALLVSNEIPNVVKNDSDSTSVTNNTNLVGLPSVILVSNKELQASLPSL